MSAQVGHANEQEFRLVSFIWIPNGTGAAPWMAGQDRRWLALVAVVTVTVVISLSSAG